MSFNVTINGTTYALPSEYETNWATEVNNWMAAVSTYGISAQGGAYPLQANLDLTNTPTDFGIIANFLASLTNPAHTGLVRLSDDSVISWRNEANTGDLTLAVVDGKLTFNGVEITDVSTAQTLTNKTIDATLNTIENLNSTNFTPGLTWTWAQVDKTGSSIADLANHSHTALTDIGVNTHATLDAHLVNISNPHSVTKAQVLAAEGIKNADVDAAAAIAWSKINKTGSSLTDLTTKSHTVLSDIGTNTHAQIDSHISNTSNPHSVTKAQVLSAELIVNADVKADAAIDGTKINPDFGSQDIVTEAQLQIGQEFKVHIEASPTEDYTLNLPLADGVSGQALIKGSGPQMEWASVPGLTLNEHNVAIGGATNFPSATDTSALGDILASSVNGFTLKPLIIDNADVSNTAAIEQSKVEDLVTDLAGKEPVQTKGSISTTTTGVTIGSGASSTVGPNVTVDVASASLTATGLVTAANQGFGGVKTFGANIVVNNSTASATPGSATQINTVNPATKGLVIKASSDPSALPVGMSFLAKYSMPNADFSLGSPTGTLLGGAAVNLGILNLTVTDSAAYYSAIGNINFAQVGTIRLDVIPGYSGSPSNASIIFCTKKTAEGGDENSEIYLYHKSTGELFLIVRNNTGSLVIYSAMGSWSPVAGVSYNIELDYDFTAGATRLFIDGIQSGSTKTTTLTRSVSDIIYFRLGTYFDSVDWGNYSIDNIALFSTVQHTSAFNNELPFLYGDQTALLLDIQDSSGASMVTVSSAGALSARSQIFSGLDANTAVYLDASKQLTSSVVTNTELGYLSGVTSSIQTQIGNLQTKDTDLTAIAALTGPGIAVKTSTDPAAATWANRSIAGTTNRIGVSNGDGAAGNPTINLDTTQFPQALAGDAGYPLVASGANAAAYGATQAQISAKEPTGFEDPAGMVVTYDSTARTISLSNPSGTYYYWIAGVRYSKSGTWTSSAHSSTLNHTYWLELDTSGNAVWTTDASPGFDHCLVATVTYFTNYKFAIRETHGLMPWQAHKEFHQTVGSYRVSGGTATAGTFIALTNTLAAVTPGTDLAVTADEDLQSSIAALIQGTYTQLYFDTNLAVFTTGAATPYITTGTASTGSPRYNENPISGTALTDITTNNRWFNVYSIFVPVTADAGSQAFRVLWLTGQTLYTSLASAQAEDFKSLSLGNLASVISEAVPFIKWSFIRAGSNNTYNTQVAANPIYLITSGNGLISVSGVVSNSAPASRYTTALSWSGTGPYTMAISGATHGRGPDPLVRVRTLVSGTTYEVIVTDISIDDSSGDVVITSNHNPTGKVVIL